MSSENRCKYYRITDPLENFQIGLTVKEGTTIRKDGETIKPFYEERVIKWQEKIHGPSEISYYLKQKENNNESRSLTEKETVRQLHNLEESGVKIKETLKNVMIFTYTQNDNHLQYSAPATTDTRGVESYLGAALTRKSHKYNTSDSGVFDSILPKNPIEIRSVQVENRIFREKPYQSMLVCLAYDVDIPALTSKHAVWDDSYYFKSHVLCEIRLYKDGLLEVTPGFNSWAQEPQAVGNESEAFVIPGDDAGFKTGYKLQTYSFRTDEGISYEYSIENLNSAPLVQCALSPEALLVPLQSIEAGGKTDPQSTKVADPTTGVLVHPNEVYDPSKWKQDPPALDSDISVTIYGEIVSGLGFEGERVYVVTDLIPPAYGDWSPRSGNLVDGVAIADLADKNYKRKHDNWADFARGITHVAINDEVFGDCSASCSLSQQYNAINYAKWGGGRGTRKMFGIGFFIVSCFSVAVLGANYPFWILFPGLFIYWVVGDGMPAGGEILVVDENACQGSDYLGQNQVSLKVPFSRESTPVVNFNHLMQYSFDVKENEKFPLSLENSLKGPSDNVPGSSLNSITVTFEVYRKGWFGRSSLEGYGYYTLPLQGSVEVEVKCWRPLGSLTTQFYEYFIGGSAHLMSSAYVGIPNPRQSTLNKFGVFSEPSGTLKFRCSVVTVDPRRCARVDEDALKKRQQNVKVRRTVEDILQNFKATGSVSNTFTGILARSSNLSLSSSISSERASHSKFNKNELSTTTGSVGATRVSEDDTRADEKPSKSNPIKEVLKSNDRANRVADILAKAKTQKVNQSDTKEADSKQTSRDSKAGASEGFKSA